MHPPNGVCLTSQVIGPAQKLDAFVALVKLGGGDARFLKEISKFSSKVFRLAEIRNRVVHDSWIIFGDGDVPHRYEATARREAGLGLVAMPTSDLLNTLEEIEDLWSSFLDLTDAAVALVPQPGIES